MSDQLHCPKCNSTQITAQKHGFSGGKAAVGAVLTGGIGLLAGLHGSSDIDITCLACGNKWNPKKLADEKKQQEHQQQNTDIKKWKRDFYQAYESNNHIQAEEIYLRKSKFFSNIPDVHAAYKFQKKNDSQATVLMVVVFSIIIILFLLIVKWIV